MDYSGNILAWGIVIYAIAMTTYVVYKGEWLSQKWHTAIFKMIAHGICQPGTQALLLTHSNDKGCNTVKHHSGGQIMLDTFGTGFCEKVEASMDASLTERDPNKKGSN